MNQEDVSRPEYWQKRYEDGTTGWDAGEITEPLRQYFEGLADKSLRILIPGAGNAWEAEWLHLNGFRNVTVLDMAPAPLKNIADRLPDFPSEHLVLDDFFNHSATYDLIVEQTFFCAINPARRMEYAQKMHQLLAPGGVLAGVLFNCHFDGGPPFGGSAADYRLIFEPLFKLRTFEPCRNSIAPRAGRELFIVLEKK